MRCLYIIVYFVYKQRAKELNTCQHIFIAAYPGDGGGGAVMSKSLSLPVCLYYVVVVRQKKKGKENHNSLLGDEEELVHSVPHQEDGRHVAEGGAVKAKHHQ